MELYDLYLKVTNNVLSLNPNFLSQNKQLVCNNNGYRLHITFDKDIWSSRYATVRFIIGEQYVDVPLDVHGNSGYCIIPLVENSSKISIGLYQYETIDNTNYLMSTTYVDIPYLPSIYSKNIQEKTDGNNYQYLTIISLLNEILSYMK